MTLFPPFKKCTILVDFKIQGSLHWSHLQANEFYYANAFLHQQHVQLQSCRSRHIFQWTCYMIRCEHILFRLHQRRFRFLQQWPAFFRFIIPFFFRFAIFLRLVSFFHGPVHAKCMLVTKRQSQLVFLPYHIIITLRFTQTAIQTKKGIAQTTYIINTCVQD